MRTLEEVIWWLSITSFAGTSVGEYAVTSELAFIHCRFDLSSARLKCLLSLSDGKEGNGVRKV